MEPEITRKNRVINEVVEMMVKEMLTLGDIENAYFKRLDAQVEADEPDMSGADAPGEEGNR